MNLPNKLTVFRTLCIPFFVFFLLAHFVPNNYLFALIVFVIASLTDLFDGKIARKYNLITNFGNFGLRSTYQFGFINYKPTVCRTCLVYCQCNYYYK